MGGLAADTELSGCRVDELVLLPPRASTKSLGYVWTPGTSSTSSMGGLAADTELSGCRVDELVLPPPQGKHRVSRVRLAPGNVEHQLDGRPRSRRIALRQSAWTSWCASSRPIEAPS